MEVLAVLLVIAVIASFAVPVVKSVRRTMRYQKAKAAGIQLAEAIRSFYTDSKGCLQFHDSEALGFSGADAAAGGACPSNNPIRTGIPVCSDEAKAATAPTAVFTCGYLSAKMFVDLPYTFKVYDPRITENGEFVTGTENMTDGRYFTVNRDMTITEDDD